MFLSRIAGDPISMKFTSHKPALILINFYDCQLVLIQLVLINYVIIFAFTISLHRQTEIITLQAYMNNSIQNEQSVFLNAVCKPCLAFPSPVVGDC